MKKLAIFLCFALLLTACREEKGLAQNITPQTPEAGQADSEFMTAFALSLYGRAGDEANLVVSPASVLYALSMSANGAEGDTLSEMLNVISPPLKCYYPKCESDYSIEENRQNALDNINLALYSFSQDNPLHIANALWVRDDFAPAVKTDYLQKIADYYRGNIYTGDFGQETVKEINRFVNKHTEGMVPEIVEELSPDTVTALVNAVYFEGKWEKEHKDTLTLPFFNAEGGPVAAEYLSGTENVYLENEFVTGFEKNYTNGYSFVALLPKEGVEIKDYKPGYREIRDLLDAAESRDVEILLPEFETDYTAELNDALENMGMPRAFDRNLRDFSNMADLSRGNLYIGKVLHRAHIKVDKEGTKAGGRTVIMNKCGRAAPDEREPMQVYLDRPFMYMIIHKSTGAPVFIGRVGHIDGEPLEIYN